MRDWSTSWNQGVDPIAVGHPYCRCGAPEGAAMAWRRRHPVGPSERRYGRRWRQAGASAGPAAGVAALLECVQELPARSGGRGVAAVLAPPRPRAVAWRRRRLQQGCLNPPPPFHPLPRRDTPTDRRGGAAACCPYPTPRQGWRPLVAGTAPLRRGVGGPGGSRGLPPGGRVAAQCSSDPRPPSRGDSPASGPRRSAAARQCGRTRSAHSTTASSPSRGYRRRRRLGRVVEIREVRVSPRVRGAAPASGRGAAE